MTTTAEMLAYLDHLEGRIEAMNASAADFVYRPNFTMVSAQIWDIPHPYENAPPTPEWGRVFFASLGAGVTLACFATMLALVKS